MRVRKPLVVIGYALSATAKPLMATAYVWPVALGVRFLDRAGKGVRTAPRDALIADVTPLASRGRAFGFHRAADSMGAVAGPAIGLGLLVALNENFRFVFLLASIPAAAGVVLLAVLREKRPLAAEAGTASVPNMEAGKALLSLLDRQPGLRPRQFERRLPRPAGQRSGSFQHRSRVGLHPLQRRLRRGCHAGWHRFRPLG